MVRCCGKRWSDRDDLNEHIIRSPNHLYFCGICCQHLASFKNLNRHMGLHEGESHRYTKTNKWSYCYFCRRQFGSEEDLNLHRRKTHCEFFCFICDREFDSVQAAEQHKISPVHFVATTRCPQYPRCKKLFKTTGGVASHLESGSCAPITRQLVAEAVRGWDTNYLITRPPPMTYRIMAVVEPVEVATQPSHRETIVAEDSREAVLEEVAEVSPRLPLNVETSIPSEARFELTKGPPSPLSDSSGSEVVVSDYAHSEVVVSDASGSDFELIEPGARSPTSSSVSGSELVLVSRGAVSRPHTPSSHFDDVPISLHPPRYFQDRVWMPTPYPALAIFYCPKCERSFGYVSGLVQHIESGACKLASLRTVQQIYSGLASQFKHLLTG